MIRVKLVDIDRKLLSRLWGRVYCDGEFVYVPSVLADRYSLRGQELSCKKATLLLGRKWKRLPRLFKRYALADCRELALRLLF